MLRGETSRIYGGNRHRYGGREGRGRVADYRVPRGSYKARIAA